MRAADRLPFREGVVVNRPVKDGQGSLVNVGLQKEVSIDKRLKPGTRVTVKLTYKDKHGTVVISDEAPFPRNVESYCIAKAYFP